MIEKTCPDCGASAARAFCADCGQQQPRAGDFSWHRMAAHGWTEISGSDSRLLRTLRALFVPGELTSAYLEHRWQRYLPPLRLYLIAAALFFLFGWDVYFDASVQQVLAMPDQAMPPAMRALYTDPLTSTRMGDLTALLKILSVLAMAAWVAVLHVTLGRPIGAHVVFALHFIAFDFVASVLLAPLIAFAPPEQWTERMNIVLFVDMVALGVWATLALRRVHRLSWIGSLWRGALVVCADLFLSFLATQAAVVWLLLRSLSAGVA